MSIFDSLSIGTKGLYASQLALNVTGQNISNANTEGYSRKRIDLSSDKRGDTKFGEMGFGVEIDKVSRYADEFLELQIRGQMSDEGFYTVFDEVFERIENILSEPNDSGLNETMEKFWNAWQDLANNPQDAAAREVTRSSSLVLTDKFQTLSRQLDELRASLDSDVVETTNEINGYIRNIYTLNGEVATGELQNGEANDSRDKRDLLIRKVSTLIDVGVVEDKLGRVTLTTSGNVLVGPSSYIELEVARRSSERSTATGLSVRTEIVFSSTKKVYKPRGGELKGIMEARDDVLPKYQKWLDQIAGTFVKEVNQLHTTGYNLDGNTGVLFFDETGTRADNMALSAALMQDARNIAASAGGSTIGLVTESSTVPLAANPKLDLKLIDSKYKNISLDSIKVMMGGVQLDEGAGKDYVVDYQFGTITFLNYARFSGSEPIDVSFRYDTAGYPGPGNGSNALDIARLRDKQSMSRVEGGDVNQSIGNFYSGVIGVLGIERNQAQANRETRRFLVEQFENRKTEITGVSLDEELANMIKFEHTYQSSARFISSINRMLDVLMNL